MAKNYAEIVVEVKDRSNIVDYITKSGVDLKQKGPMKWKGLCPFHNEKTPSFDVSEEYQNYRCWGCGKHGDILTFIMNDSNLDFHEALELLAAEVGVEIKHEDENDRVDYKSIKRAVSIAADFYKVKFDELDSSHTAKKEVSQRGLPARNSEDVWYGYSPKGMELYKKLSGAGFSDEILVQSGLFREGRNGLFPFLSGRLMFLFGDIFGKPVGFAGRKIFEDDGMPGKYVNTTETPIFKKSKVLFNYRVARENAVDEKRVYVCEGQFDVIAMVEAGIKNTVAAGGTAFTEKHLDMCLKMASNGEVVFCFDGDEAGEKAAMKILANFPDSHENTFVVPFPPQGDPCDYSQQNGPEALVEYVRDNKEHLVSFVAKRLGKKHDLDNPVGRSQYIKEAAVVAKTITNKTLRNDIAKRIAIQSISSLDEVLAEIEVAKPYKKNTKDDYKSWSMGDLESGNEKTSSDDDPHDQSTDVDEEQHKEDTEPIVDLNTLKQYMDASEYYDASVRFVSMALKNRKWRGALIGSAQVLPPLMQRFIRELASMKDREKLYPELFTDRDMAEVLMGEEFTPFIDVMSEDERLEQVRRLKTYIKRYIKAGTEDRVFASNAEVLNNSRPDDIELFREIIKREEEL